MNENIRRPERHETADYYRKYIDLVPNGDIRSILESQAAETVAFLEAIPQTLAGHRYAAGKWSIAEALCHINDTERLFTMRAFWFARGFESPLPSYEPDPAVKMARPEERPWSAHVREFEAIRASTVAFFENLPPDAWVRSGVASDCPFSVRSLAYIAAGHVIHHTQVLRERYL
jgi:hypothetical protein